MLVSSIVRFNASKGMTNAAFGNVQNAAQMANPSNNTFGGEHNLTMLNQMDKKLSLDLASNSLLYKLNSLTEKLVQKHQEQNTHKSSLNLLAIVAALISDPIKLIIS